jgi:hypothetical protein
LEQQRHAITGTAGILPALLADATRAFSGYRLNGQSYRSLSTARSQAFRYTTVEDILNARLNLVRYYLFLAPSLTIME